MQTAQMMTDAVWELPLFTHKDTEESHISVAAGYSRAKAVTTIYFNAQCFPSNVVPMAKIETCLRVLKTRVNQLS